MMKKILALLVLSSYLFSYDFTYKNILGAWIVEPYKENKTISFGTYIGKYRNETITLFFNRRGMLKVQETGDVYNYEIIDNDLKIYKTKMYKHGFSKKLKKKYQLLRLVKRDGICFRMKVIKSKMPNSYVKKDGVRICKIRNYPIQVDSN